MKARSHFSLWLLVGVALLLPPKVGFAQQSAAQATLEVSFFEEAIQAEEGLMPAALAEALRLATQLIHRGEASANLWVLAWTLQEGQVVDGRPLGAPQPVPPGTHALSEIVSQEHLSGFLQATGSFLSEAFVRGEQAYGSAEVLALPDSSVLSTSALQEAMGSMRLPVSIVDELPAGEDKVTVVLFAAPQPPTGEVMTHRPAAFVLSLP